MTNIITFPSPNADCPVNLFTTAQRAALMGLACRVAGGDGGRMVEGEFETPVPLMARDCQDEEFYLMPGGWPGSYLGAVYFVDGPGRAMALMSPDGAIVGTSGDVAEIVRAAEGRLGLRVTGRAQG